MAGKKGSKWANKPGKKKQVQTFLDPDTYNNLYEHSKIKKISRSKIIRDILKGIFNDKA